MRRFSIEAFSRASSEDMRNTIMHLNVPSATDEYTAKAQSRGHHRQFSNASEISTSSFTTATSDSSLHTRRSSALSSSEFDTAGIYRPDELVPDSLQGVAAPPMPSGRFGALKSMFRRSKEYPRHAIMVKHPGAMDQKALERVVADHPGPPQDVTSFKMASHSYVGYSRLAGTLEYLSQTLPYLQEVVLYSQVYTLEELNSLTPFITRFMNLRKLAILDTMDDPPKVCPTLCKIITLWAIDCPSLQTVQFRTGAWWEPKSSDWIDEKHGETEWAEHVVGAIDQKF